MSQIVDDLRQVAIEIKTETQVGGNTAARVGGAFERVADALEGTQQIEDMDAAVAAVQQAAAENEQTIQDIVNSLAVVQTTGQSASAVMSQKAVTDSLVGTAIAYNNSQSGLAAGNVQEALDVLSEDVDEAASIKQNSSTADLDVADPNGYILLRLENGHVKTKRFDSSKLAQIGTADADTEFNIADEQGYVILREDGGNIFVKNFTNAPLRGKKISFIGDSITTYEGYAGSYVPYYKASNMNITGMTSVDKTWWKALCDKQGAAVNRIYAYGGGDVATRLCLHYNELYSNGLTGTPPDFIFILAGINDFGHNITLGTINDAEAANSTFYAGYKYLLGNLRTEYPNAIIIGLTMLNSMYLGTTVPYINNSGDSIRDFCDAIKDCCDFYSIPYIDLNKLVNINGGNYTTYLADYTHPNAVGASLITNAIKNNIINLTNE